MPPLDHFPWINGKFLDIEWTVWKVVGWLGNAIFFSRFVVQWYATEKRKQVVVPALFWWLSIAGSLVLLAYAIFDHRGSVIIFSYAFTWIPYVRNLIIHHRHEKAQRPCAECGLLCPPSAAFCSRCGAKLTDEKLDLTPALSSEERVKPPPPS
jgi:lipid-A-disaccharide synthase-like uncharacterized protein